VVGGVVVFMWQQPGRRGPTASFGLSVEPFLRHTTRDDANENPVLAFSLSRLSPCRARSVPFTFWRVRTRTNVPYGRGVISPQEHTFLVIPFVVERCLFNRHTKNIQQPAYSVLFSSKNPSSFISVCIRLFSGSLY
jgi:hypothetical protein